MAEYAITWSPLDDLFPSQELVYRWLHAYIQHRPVSRHLPVSYRIRQRSLLRSRQWGYDAAFLDACRPALTFTPQNLGAQHAVVAAADGEVVGFYTLKGTLPEGELDNLWVEPRHMGRGVGRRLWRHAMDAATSIGLTAVLIEADPNAEGFYLAMGAERVGMIASTAIPGRLLPRLRYRLS